MIESSPHRCVVRLTTSYWGDDRGVHLKKSLITLKRKSSNLDTLNEESTMIGADEAIAKITNLDSCPDGVYSLVLCNIQRDWEYGHVDDYDFKLVPYTEESNGL